jgi:Ca2+-binding RTX toxin-like protein
MTINLTSGDDVYVAMSEERVNGLGGDDRLLVGFGIEGSLDGGSGSDRLRGNDGRDTLLGGSGNDIIQGGLGRDYVVGGFGSDDISGGGVAAAASGIFGGDTYRSHEGFVSNFVVERDIFRLSPGTATNRNSVTLNTDYLGGFGAINVVNDASHAQILDFTGGDKLNLKYALPTYDISYVNQIGVGGQLDTVLSYQGDMVAIVADVSLTRNGGSLVGGSAGFGMKR